MSFRYPAFKDALVEMESQAKRENEDTLACEGQLEILAEVEKTVYADLRAPLDLL